MGEAKRRRLHQLANLKVPRTGEDPLPHPGTFGKDEFLRARFYSETIAAFATKEEHEVLLAFAREKRMPFMTFGDHLEAMARYLHAGKPVEKLIESSKKSKEQLEAEFKLTDIVREATKRHGTGHKCVPMICEGILQLFPGSTREEVDAAFRAGITSEGFSTSKVVELMFVQAASR